MEASVDKCEAFTKISIIFEKKLGLFQGLRGFLNLF
jgi:hypothetical protein